jgi:hypothetical protein
MIHRFGHRERFAIEPGQVLQGTPTTGIRVVELWAAGRELCCDDDHAFVPQFCTAVEATITWLLSDHDRSFPHAELSPEDNHRRLQAGEYEDRSRYFFMDWGPTTDSVSSYLFRRGTDAIITFEFWRPTHPRPDERGRVFVAELPERELLRSLHQAVCVLRSGT